MTIKDYISYKTIELSDVYSTKEAEYVLELFVLDFLGFNKNKLPLIRTNEIEVDLENYLNKVCERLSKNEPFQYVLGYENFYGFDFIVNENVLIPRPETEELVEWVLQSFETKQDFTGIDIGTGSGCIPITIQKYFPNSKITAVDVSEKALETAKMNSEKLETNVDFKCVDILNESEWHFESKFDAIISNPPYIPNVEKALMHANVLDFEPHLALFVEDEDALIFYSKIADFAKKYLTQNGFLFFECNEYNALNVKGMLVEKGFKNIELKKDMSGKDRMIKAGLT